uniref:Uncharacterized protein n=1 Tax=Palpitomonas bilix TaxID=652834 RepID=A0A7S3GCW2_9EUKA|mmetsp:Transcript_43766/g.114151  ORF Transcript_43766/g.114151 Transcript_43766/m.114151 type:complete len:100 (+) Transcript_43766:198-497(+)
MSFQFHGDPQDLWKMVFEKTFPENPADLDLDEIDTINVEDFAEPTIDSMAMQKMYVASHSHVHARIWKPRFRYVFDRRLDGCVWVCRSPSWPYFVFPGS